MKGLVYVFVVGIFLLVTSTACTPPVAQDSADIRALSGVWIDALNAGDLDTLVGLYTEDSRVMPPNEPMGQGSEAVSASFGAMIDAGLGGTLSTVEAMTVGDVGYHVGTYSLTAGGAEVDRGKFIELWRKVGGEWKISADMFNSDLPVTGSGGTTLIGTHAVEDGERWLAAWRGENSRHEMFAEHGVPNVRTFQSADDPNLTGLMMDVQDMDALMAFLQSEEGAAAKAEDGVIDATVRILGEVE